MTIGRCGVPVILGTTIITMLEALENMTTDGITVMSTKNAITMAIALAVQALEEPRVIMAAPIIVTMTRHTPTETDATAMKAPITTNATLPKVRLLELVLLN
ncbi:hypothetical protein EMPG_10496 [Blastomyces silverae]|uniref:Uncharacterized protein n=1 Tax=Blastomyces silverae TaxID=2060906 RepID=A0A0H1B4W7_9EURO|nr:hypothetical protein EMPG_10496 [Blastomyces silverae]